MGDKDTILCDVHRKKGSWGEYRTFRLALVKNHARMRLENKMSWYLWMKVTLKQADADWLNSGARW